ncbi:hypothetical protein HAX54_047114 [Datura stramonium]|uniref:Uncharacterized protein n=1 Tax=Datura stramonium TaxID=4076 RepID=A0ABS8WHV3_DATST|nr:hypothetical protein [Datura stramonium]
MDSTSRVEESDRNIGGGEGGGEGPSSANTAMEGGRSTASAAPPSRYESQKRRDWNTFLHCSNIFKEVRESQAKARDSLRKKRKRPSSSSSVTTASSASGGVVAVEGGGDGEGNASGGGMASSAIGPSPPTAPSNNIINTYYSQF